MASIYSLGCELLVELNFVMKTEMYQYLMNEFQHSPLYR